MVHGARLVPCCDVIFIETEIMVIFHYIVKNKNIYSHPNVYVPTVHVKHNVNYACCAQMNSVRLTISQPTNQTAWKGEDTVGTKSCFLVPGPHKPQGDTTTTAVTSASITSPASSSLSSSSSYSDNPIFNVFSFSTFPSSEKRNI